MANGFAGVAQSFRETAEHFDNLSEDARESAELTKAAALKALGALDEQAKDDLVDGLGEATTDQERCDAAKKALDALQKELDDLQDQLDNMTEETDGISDFGQLVIVSPAARDALAALKALYEDLVKIKTFETIRDTFRTVADVFDAM